ncbi:cytochrome P450 [Aspergillus cavernicola]|uniref:Cytochrome P450 n=1 Tax=Aspergillus cavernicola TaxID=176166 RepID=A0ABR4I6W2_9EURO
MWLLLILTLLSLYILNCTRQIYTNIVVARRTNLSYFVAPFSYGIIPTLLYNTTWFPYIINTWLPPGLADNLNDVVANYRWRTKDRQVKRYGGVYLVVTPKRVMCNVADAGVVSQIMNNRGGFSKPVWQYKIIELYGPNIVICEDAQWARHRRQVTNIFNEKSNDLVWKESIRLANGMIEHWKESSLVDASHRLVVETIRDDILKFALNVFSGAGFGVRMPFKVVAKDSVEAKGPYGIFQDTITPSEGFDFTFRSVTAYMNVKLNTVVFANRFIPKWVPRVLLPFLKRDFAAHRDLLGYLERLISIAEAENSATASNLIQGMLRNRKRSDMPLSKETCLSDLEIISNAHIFTIAGHETTATTLRYALLLMAIHQEIQEWVYQGINEATKDEPADVTGWDYARVYPKLITPLCVMLETMRLYPPAVTIPKWTGDSSSTVHYQGKEVLLDKGVNVNLNMNALHYSEEYWGPDASNFDPRRWDAKNEKSFLANNGDLPGLNGPGLEYSTIHKPVRGAYLPFSDGTRACVGKKFAQVEFIVTFAVLLRRYRVELPQGGDEGRKNAQRALDESFSVVALVMRDNLPLAFRERR